MKRLPPVALVAAVALVAIVVAGCGSSNNKSATAASSTNAGSSTTASSSSGGTTIKTGHSSVGTFLVDGQGRTLYLFEADKPNVSKCAGGCLTIWPPFTAKGKPTVSGGVSAGKVGTAKAPDGTTLVTYNGHPLYFYSGDQGPGDMNGQGLNQFGAKWYVVKPSGSKLDSD